MHPRELWLSTQKSPQGTYDPLDLKDPQPVVVLSDLPHNRGRQCHLLDFRREFHFLAKQIYAGLSN